MRKNYPYITAALIVINIGIFLAMDLTGGTGIGRMIAWGADWYPRTVAGGEWYRLLTSCFLHFDIEHVAGNMLSLGVLGSRLEPLAGRKRYLLIYLISGIGSSLVSVLMDELLGHYYCSAGASGAIFGLCGALLVLLLIRKERVGGVGFPQLAAAAAVMTWGTFRGTGIDWQAHMSGLLIGAAAGALLGIGRKERPHHVAENEGNTRDCGRKLI